MIDWGVGRSDILQFIFSLTWTNIYVCISNRMFQTVCCNVLFQVFFSIMIAAFSLGYATPPLAKFSEARGAAFTVYQMIEKVRTADNPHTKFDHAKSQTGRSYEKDIRIFTVFSKL